jgi:hypothetical protein
MQITETLLHEVVYGSNTLEWQLISAILYCDIRDEAGVLYLI